MSTQGQQSTPMSSRAGGGRFGKPGKQKRSSGGGKVALKDGNKGKRGSKSTGESPRVDHHKPAKKQKGGWMPTTPT